MPRLPCSAESPYDHTWAGRSRRLCFALPSAPPLALLPPIFEVRHLEDAYERLAALLAPLWVPEPGALDRRRVKRIMQAARTLSWFEHLDNEDRRQFVLDTYRVMHAHPSRDAYIAYLDRWAEVARTKQQRARLQALKNGWAR